MGVEYAKMSLIGTVGRDAELRYTPSGTAEANFSVASNRTNKRNGEPEQKTTWFNVRIYGTFAEKMTQYILKGKLVFVDGQLDVRDYVDKSGKDRYSLDVRGDSIQLLSKNENAASEGGAPTASSAPRKAAAAAAKPAAPAVEDEFDFGDAGDAPF